MAKLAQLVPSWDVGGRAQLVASFVAASPNTPTFSSPDDRGTLDIGASSYSVGVFTFKSRWANEANSTGARFMYAQIDGVLGLTPSFRVVRSNLGLTIGASSAFAYSYDGEVWERFANRGSDATYYTWSHSSSFTANRVYVSVWPAWTTGRTLPWIQSLEGSGFVSDTTSSSSYIFETRSATVDELGDPVSATPMYAFKIGTSGSAPDGNPKRNVVMISGQHASEDVGNYALKGAVELLVSDDPQAVIARNWFNFFVYPLVSSAGRKGGATRGDFQSGYMTSDTNRVWNASTFETVTKHKAAIAADTGGECVVFMDFHGDVTENTGYNQYESGNAVTEWAAALQSYEPTFNMTLSANAGYATAWAQSTFTPELSLICEFGYITSNTTQVQQETAGANHLRALALLADQEFFGFSLAVEGTLLAVDTGQDTASIIGAGQFSSTGFLSGVETTSDTASMPGILFASAGTAHLNYTGRVPVVTQSAFLGSTSEWNVVVDSEVSTFIAT